VDHVEYLFGDMWGVALPRAELARLPEADRIPYALRQLAAKGVDLGFEPAAAERILNMFVTSERAMRGYRPRRLDGAGVYFRARERRPRDPVHPELGWASLFADGLTVEVVPGDHVTMHEPPHVVELAQRM